MTKEILDFLDKNVTFLATKGTCGNPRVRPMKSALYKDGKLYFCTSNKKGMYKHMQNFPGVELSAFDGENMWIRIRGEVKFDTNLAIKEAMFEKYPSLEAIYQTPQNLDFIVFYLEKVSIKIQDFKGRDEVLRLD
ncbi:MULTISPECIES: pyridoxamine 5'-phosphate oxidase family protein [Helicobacter]|uniref:Pyridoxamine 5'-phosphate oxidase family protein n=1 Tax=Helicobacter colisuis TaxID=2949739 RepID=A0ABT0TUM4_9HELI|nr:MULTISPECIES: pyridoxamine 5'-phosphate oxidase family protein [Helicobacter]MCI2235851.1 pyridoxamine 5'-phosphate oxidase family protein [Helicobacter sp. CaF467b]MCI7047816.1 pyridoxamine 5'-phosphate oxidase family protein [Helicobacter sp.]MCL9819163.1 pyridoxamine 5'-phosphate oxidase family protein [Helicobacter colisuis]MCL9821316.1 pyridoxamine 5'-phosphate oxidase family protein [Helicobacter colisuis]MCL9822713.1 pyridoxamine 5'-phosphate oxidase family protein [Helicobacter coli